MLRIGLLGAARIAPAALIKPAKALDGVEVAAVAARDPARAARFAAKHGIPVVHGTYADVIEDPSLDAVYNPLPNNLHHEYTMRSLEAGKHVLCEKPIASNTSQRSAMALCAERNDRILMEAFHYRYHPLAQRMREIIAGGSIGAVRHIDVNICTTLRKRNDIRLRYELAGGALMDVGCYAVHMARTLADAEPAVRSAKPRLWSSAVDRSMQADLVIPGRRDCAHRLLALHTNAAQNPGAGLWGARPHACDQPHAAPLLPPDCPDYGRPSSLGRAYPAARPTSTNWQPLPRPSARACRP